MNVEIWSTTIMFYIATLALHKKEKKTKKPWCGEAGLATS